MVHSKAGSSTRASPALFWRSAGPSAAIRTCNVSTYSTRKFAKHKAQPVSCATFSGGGFAQAALRTFVCPASLPPAGTPLRAYAVASQTMSPGLDMSDMGTGGGPSMPSPDLRDMATLQLGMLYQLLSMAGACGIETAPAGSQGT